MATYKELRNQLEALTEKTEAARLAEFQTIVDDIRVKVAEYGRQHNRTSKKVVAPVEAKYRDPKTGATWSGRGRAPAWIKDAKNRNRFLIQE
jgi:DNA-binding protein H-NS